MSKENFGSFNDVKQVPETSLQQVSGGGIPAEQALNIDNYRQFENAIAHLPNNQKDQLRDDWARKYHPDRFK